MVELGDRHPCQASVCSHGGFAEDPGESMPPSTEPEGVGPKARGPGDAQSKRRKSRWVPMLPLHGDWDKVRVCWAGEGAPPEIDAF